MFSLQCIVFQVEGISKRMEGLTVNFNYALGRIGLVTQEFSQISAGIADAMTSLKKDVQAVQSVAAGEIPTTYINY